MHGVLVFLFVYVMDDFVYVKLATIVTWTCVGYVHDNIGYVFDVFMTIL